MTGDHHATKYRRCARLSGVLSKHPATKVKESGLLAESVLSLSVHPRLTAAATDCLVIEHCREILEVIDRGKYYSSVYISIKTFSSISSELL